MVRSPPENTCTSSTRARPARAPAPCCACREREETPRFSSPGKTGAASYVGGVAVDGAYAYWSQVWYDDGWLLRAPIAGGSPELLATGQLLTGGVTLGATDVFWIARPTASSPYEYPRRSQVTGQRREPFSACFTSSANTRSRFAVSFFFITRRSRSQPRGPNLTWYSRSCVMRVVPPSSSRRVTQRMK